MGKYERARAAVNEHRPGKTFREIAKETGISASYLCEVAKGKKKPKCCQDCRYLQGFWCEFLNHTIIRPDIQSCRLFGRKS